MQGPDYIFYIQDQNNRFYQPDSTGKIVVSSQPYALEFSPDGWEEIEIQNVRNKKYWGIDRSVAAHLNYVGDGAQILKTIMLTKGHDISTYLNICRQMLELNPGVDFTFWYKQIFKGQIDFSTYVHEGIKVSATSLEEGLAKYLKAGEATTFELPMNVPEGIMVKMDGIPLHNKVNYSLPGINDAGGGVIGFENLGTLPITLTTQEGDGYGLDYLSVNPEMIGDRGGDITAWMASSDNWFIRNSGNIPVTFTIEGYKKISSVGNTSPVGVGPIFWDFYFSHSNGSRFDIVRDFHPASDTTYEYNYSFTITLNPGEKLFSVRLFHKESDFGESFIVVLYDETSFDKINAITRRPATYVPHFRAQYIFEQLIYKMTDGIYAADILAFFTKWKDVVFTCGDAIRGIVDGDGNSMAVMKITFANHFFQFWDCFFSAGISVTGNKVGFDEKINLVDTINRIALPEPASPIKISFAKEYAFNVVRFGYPEIKNDIGVLNGNEEFNCTFEFTTGGNTVSPAVLDKVSKIKASCYEQEKIRTTLYQKDSTDNKADNDVFVNYIDSVLQPAGIDYPAHYLLDRSLNSTATGLLEPLGVWNIRLSPKRMFLNNGAYIRSCQYLGDNKIFKYTSSDKNNKLECNGISEKADVPVASLAPRFFYPLIISMDMPIQSNILDQMDANALATYEVPIDGNTFTGILLKNGINTSSRKTQPCDMLLDSSNDITKFINYYG